MICRQTAAAEPNGDADHSHLLHRPSHSWQLFQSESEQGRRGCREVSSVGDWLAVPLVDAKLVEALRMDKICFPGDTTKDPKVGWTWTRAAD